MTGGDPDVLRDRYWLNESWEEHDGLTYWSAFDEQEREEVFIQQLRPRGTRTARRRSDHGKDAVALPGDLAKQVRPVAAADRGHLLAVHELFEEEGSLWIVMDPVQPFTLHHLMRQRGHLGAAEVSHLGAEVASALRELHEAGAVHGQVEPRNIFLRADRTVALAGYGLEPAPNDAAGPWVRPWRPKSPYTPPEWADRKAERPPPPTRSGDLWAMGMTLYEAVSGRSPTRALVRKAHWTRKLYDARPPKVGGELELSRLLEQLLSPRPGVRTSVGPSLVSLRRLAQQHEPLAAGHWAVANRPRRTVIQRLRAASLKIFATITSRVVASFVTGAVVTALGLHLANKGSTPDALTFVASAAVFGAASGSVVVGARVALHLWAYLRLKVKADRKPAVVPPAPPPSDPRTRARQRHSRGKGTRDAVARLPPCEPSLTIRQTPVGVGVPTPMEFTLDVPAGHPWHPSTTHDARPADELMLVVSPRSTGATVRPQCVIYRPQTPRNQPAAFTFTAHEPGRHQLRITVYHRAYGVVLQELDATVNAGAAPARLSHARRGKPER
ncbi:hypothetical protein SUDANB105_07628 [Streptomyces sp. enrichment culture]